MRIVDINNLIRNDEYYYLSNEDVQKNKLSEGQEVVVNEGKLGWIGQVKKCRAIQFTYTKDDHFDHLYLLKQSCDLKLIWIDFNFYVYSPFKPLILEEVVVNNGLEIGEEVLGFNSDGGWEARVGYSDRIPPQDIERLVKAGFGTYEEFGKDIIEEPQRWYLELHDPDDI